jgi:hypothetical protein
MRARYLAPLILVLVLFAASISITPATSAKIVDEQNRPLAGAFVYAFHHTPAIVNPLGHRPPDRTTVSLFRSDASGLISIPRQCHFHLPFLQFVYKPYLEIAVYVPSLHNFCRIDVDPDWDPQYPCSSEQSRFRKTDGLLILYNLSAKPESWYYSVFQLAYNAFVRLHAAPADRAELAAAMKQEYKQFGAAYAQVPREIRSDKFVWVGAEERQAYAGQTRPWSFFLEQRPLDQPIAQRMAELVGENIKQ